LGKTVLALILLCTLLQLASKEVRQINISTHNSGKGMGTQHVQFLAKVFNGGKLAIICIITSF